MTTQSPELPPVLVVVGPSAAGKGTLTKLLFETFPGKFGKKISHTTRAPRAGEQNGKDYHFVTMEQFDQMDANGEFIETAFVHGQKYATSFDSVIKAQANDCIALLELDFQGLISFDKILKERRANTISNKPVFGFHAIWITVESIQVLEERLRNRGTETEEQIANRLVTAKAEFAFYEQNHYLFNNVVLNTTLDIALAALVQSIENAYKSPGMLTKIVQKTE